MSVRTVAFLAMISQALAYAEPLVTAAARLAPRATNPSLVGYVSASGGYSDVRSCDYPQTISTLGQYVQCCPTTGACPFYTACSSNTLFAASESVACDVASTLTCNTAIIEQTAGNGFGDSYLACWQKTLGSSAFTIVQNVPTSSIVAASTGTVSSASSSTSSASRTSSASGSTAAVAAPSGSTIRASSSSGTGSSVTHLSTTSASQASATSVTRNAGSGTDASIGGGILGAIAILAQMLL